MGVWAGVSSSNFGIQQFFECTEVMARQPPYFRRETSPQHINNSILNFRSLGM
jgi:hypothetical protein